MTAGTLVTGGAELPALVVFSHLDWDSPYRRPQEIFSRLAAQRRVLFVEQPRFHAGDPSAIVRVPARNVTVLAPRTPLNAPGFHDDQIPLLSKLVANALAREQMQAYGAWLDTPMALPLLKKLEPSFIVYDCIADLAALPGAPRQLAQRENALLRMANAVTCASHGVWRTRRAQRDDAQWIDDSVDATPFACAAEAGSVHPDVKALARPRLGYAGVVDARLDWEVIRALAEARPEWEICLVGPIAHVDPGALPRAPNLHYFGERAHADLPMHVAGWDVALLPMVPDDAAHFTARATALEYMAAGRPIVSTSIPDLARSAAHVVRFGADAPAFIAACDAALTAGAADRERRGRAMAEIVRATSWDETVRAVDSILRSAAAEGLTDVARHMLKPAQSAVARTPRLPARSPCVILGAGATGLATAYHYGAGCTLVEREAEIGGGCRSLEDTGFTFDRGLHVMTSDDPHVQELYRLLLGDNVHWQECDAQALGGEGATPNLRPVAPVDATPAPYARFGYPLRGGFAALVNGFAPLLRAEIVLRAAVRKVSPLLRTVTLADGRRLRYDVLVSTLPLPCLVAAMEDEAPPEIRRAAAALRHTSLRCVHLGVARPHVTTHHWIESRGNAIFTRVSAPGNLSPHCNPRGGFGLTCEIPYSEGAPLPLTGAALTNRCIRDLMGAGLLHRSDGLLTSNQTDLAYANVTDDGTDVAARVRDWLAQFDIVPAGRFGAWQHGDAFVAGRNAALAAQRGSCDRVEATAGQEDNPEGSQPPKRVSA